MKHYFVGYCRVCRGQGRMEIAKEIKTNTAFACCEECEAQYDTPESFLNGGYAHCEKYGRRYPATLEEIRVAGWEKYITSTSDVDYIDYWNDDYDDEPAPANAVVTHVAHVHTPVSAAI